MDWLQRLHKSVTVPEPKDLHRRRYPRQHYKIRVSGITVVSRQIFSQHTITISLHQWSHTVLLAMTTELISWKRVALKIRDPPTRSLQPRALILQKMMTTMEMAKHLVWPLCQHRNVLAPDLKIEMAGFDSLIGKPRQFISSIRSSYCISFAYRKASIAYFAIQSSQHTRHHTFLTSFRQVWYCWRLR